MGTAYNANIVTDSLVLCLDAANPRSYPGSGTNWYDLSGNGHNGTLVNGPTFNIANRGNLVFDGSNDHVKCTPQNTTTNGLYFGGSTTISVSAWVKNNTTNTFNNFVMYEDIIGKNGVEPVRLATLGHEGINYCGFFIGQSNNTYVAVSNTILNSTDYYYLTGTFGGGYIKIYVNGVFESQTSLSGSIDTPISGLSARWIIGAGELGDARYLNGNISQVFIYDKVLSPNEVRQNFNATRGRYGY